MDFLPDFHYRWMSKRWLAAAVAIVAVIASIISLFVPGPVLGTDFAGGTELEVDFAGPVTAGELRQVLERTGFTRPDVVHVTTTASPYRYIVRVAEVSAISGAKRAELARALCFADDVQEAICPEAIRPTELKVSAGGDRILLRYRDAPDTTRIESQLGSVAGIQLRSKGEAILIRSARDHRVEIQLESLGDRLFERLRTELGAERMPSAPLRTDWVGPKAGAQLRNTGLKSIGLAMLCIMVYIAFRFDMRFAPGVAVAVLNDAIVTSGVLIATRTEINLVIVAAMLTMVSYSTNDKVVVYDRIRENLGKMRGAAFERIIDTSLSEVLRRTLITGVPTMFSLLAFFVWGTGSLRDFAFTLIVGVLVGTFSSYYIAVPFTWWFDARFFAARQRRVSRQRRPARADAQV
jgi:preprotein translocase subunit SecF